MAINTKKRKIYSSNLTTKKRGKTIGGTDNEVSNPLLTKAAKEETKEEAKEQVKEEVKEKAKEEVKEEVKEKAKEEAKEEVKEEAKEETVESGITKSNDNQIFTIKLEVPHGKLNELDIQSVSDGKNELYKKGNPENELNKMFTVEPKNQFGWFGKSNPSSNTTNSTTAVIPENKKNFEKSNGWFGKSNPSSTTTNSTTAVTPDNKANIEKSNENAQPKKSFFSSLTSTRKKRDPYLGGNTIKKGGKRKTLRADN